MPEPLNKFKIVLFLILISCHLTESNALNEAKLEIAERRQIRGRVLKGKDTKNGKASKSMKSTKSSKISKSSKVTIEAKTITLRNNKIVKLTAETDPIALTASVNVEQTGMIEISTTGIYFTPFSNTEITANLVDFPVFSKATKSGFINNISPDAALTIGEFITQQLSAAAEFSMREEEELGNVLRKRRLDEPGCDMIPDSSCNIGCCAVHDKCFDENDCNAGSWARTICTNPVGAVGAVLLGPLGAIACTVSVLTTSQECADCNSAVASCIARGCTGISDAPPESCYDNKCDTFYDCPGKCEFFSSDDSKCCGCKDLGDTCNAPQDTCGNGKCDEGESSVNCFVDCVYEPIPPSSSPSPSSSLAPSRVPTKLKSSKSSKLVKTKSSKTKLPKSKKAKSM